MIQYKMASIHIKKTTMCSTCLILMWHLEWLKILLEQWLIMIIRPLIMEQGKEDFEGGDHEYQGLSQLTGGSSKFKDPS